MLSVFDDVIQLLSSGNNTVDMVYLEFAKAFEKGQALEEVMDAKYLGVTLGDDLEWSKHIATMTNKANS